MKNRAFFEFGDNCVICVISVISDIFVISGIVIISVTAVMGALKDAGRDSGKGVVVHG
jgi:hypothetical protein